MHFMEERTHLELDSFFKYFECKYIGAKYQKKIEPRDSDYIAPLLNIYVKSGLEEFCYEKIAVCIFQDILPMVKNNNRNEIHDFFDSDKYREKIIKQLLVWLKMSFGDSDYIYNGLYPEFEEYRKQFIDDFDILQDKLNKIKPNTVKRNVNQRTEQSLIRSIILEIRSSCDLNGVEKESVLDVCHIKPHRDCNEDEKLDANNLLLLMPTYHRLFDLGYISFEDDGTILISKEIEKDINKYGLTSNMKLKWMPKDNKYLMYHRENTFVV